MTLGKAIWHACVHSGSTRVQIIQVPIAQGIWIWRVIGTAPE